MASRPAAAVAGADAGQEAPLLVVERLQPLALHLLQEFVHPPFLGLALLQFALRTPGRPPLEPALQRVRRLAPRRRGGGLVALQAGVALGEVVAERGLVAAR